jgi:hypothetical protein
MAQREPGRQLLNAAAGMPLLTAPLSGHEVITNGHAV